MRRAVLARNCSNTGATQEKNLWVTRKGATSAREVQYGIIPGSMGAAASDEWLQAAHAPAAVLLSNQVGSYIVKGRGARGCLGSCRSMLPGDVACGAKWAAWRLLAELLSWRWQAKRPQSRGGRGVALSGMPWAEDHV